MKRAFAAAVMAIALIWPASVAAALPSWNLTGTYTFTFVCITGCATTYNHSVTITSSDNVTGAVAGTAFWIDNPALDQTVQAAGVNRLQPWQVVGAHLIHDDDYGQAGYRPDRGRREQ